MSTLIAVLVLVLALFAALMAAVEPVMTIILGIYKYLRRLFRGPIKTEPFEGKKRVL
ncbi:MAG TPA: hypothetical protein VD999_01290 [Vitreimonas sp.]|nr:hypothetical protein [Vitreimonas sp.]